jgi:Protein of unknown function (DUF2442)
MNEVTEIEYRGEYVYRVSFEDCLQGEIDFSGYLARGLIFEPLREKALFSQAKVEDGTIGWPNAADVAPETLYEKLQGIDALPEPIVERDAGG